MLIDNIGTLVTNDPELGDARATPRSSSSDGVVAWAGPRATTPRAPADERFDAGGPRA